MVHLLSPKLGGSYDLDRAKQPVAPCGGLRGQVMTHKFMHFTIATAGSLARAGHREEIKHVLLPAMFMLLLEDGVWGTMCVY